jgi:BirA family biotin operon repressor/biotin-[acetyl-CoA-carboxylase] ligase
MATADDWGSAASPDRRLGVRVEHHAEIGSTNDRARALLASGGEGVAVVAELQTAGRGRQGRTWVSPPGVNLMVSVAIRPDIDPSLSSLLGLSVALALRAACTPFVPDRLAIRWPNDLVDDAGLKVAGVLIETAVDRGGLREAVIGMGINVNWRRSAMPPEIASGASSLIELADGPIDRATLLRRLLDELAAEIDALERGESPIARAREASSLDGRSVEVDLGDRMVAGRVAGLSDEGSLLLDAAEGRVALSIGEVVRVLDAATVRS